MVLVDLIYDTAQSVRRERIAMIVMFAQFKLCFKLPEANRHAQHVSVSHGLLNNLVKGLFLKSFKLLSRKTGFNLIIFQFDIRGILFIIR